MNSDAPNRSTKGALDGADWYVLHVTTSTKNMLKGTTNHGWKIHDSGLGSSSSTTYRSSDYASPYKPELVIDHTAVTPPATGSFGNRPYESSTGSGQNCMGYALDIKEPIDNEVLFSTKYATSDDMTDVSKCQSLSQLIPIVDRVSQRYMTAKLGSSGYTSIHNYNSSIGSNRYRTVMRVGVKDNNNMPGWQLNCKITGGGYDDWDYHWRYQTSSGDWAEKNGNENSKLLSNSRYTDPCASTWYEAVPYASVGYYYSIVTR